MEPVCLRTPMVWLLASQPVHQAVVKHKRSAIFVSWLHSKFFEHLFKIVEGYSSRFLREIEARPVRRFGFVRCADGIGLNINRGLDVGVDVSRQCFNLPALRIQRRTVPIDGFA